MGSLPSQSSQRQGMDGLEVPETQAVWAGGTRAVGSRRAGLPWQGFVIHGSIRHSRACLGVPGVCSGC